MPLKYYECVFTDTGDYMVVPPEEMGEVVKAMEVMVSQGIPPPVIKQRIQEIFFPEGRAEDTSDQTKAKMEEVFKTVTHVHEVHEDSSQECCSRQRRGKEQPSSPVQGDSYSITKPTPETSDMLVPGKRAEQVLEEEKSTVNQIDAVDSEQQEPPEWSPNSCTLENEPTLLISKDEKNTAAKKSTPVELKEEVKTKPTVASRSACPLSAKKIGENPSPPITRSSSPNTRSSPAATGTAPKPTSLSKTSLTDTPARTSRSSSSAKAATGSPETESPASGSSPTATSSAPTPARKTSPSETPTRTSRPSSSKKVAAGRSQAVPEQSKPGSSTALEREHTLQAKISEKSDGKLPKATGSKELEGTRASTERKVAKPRMSSKAASPSTSQQKDPPMETIMAGGECVGSVNNFFEGQETRPERRGSNQTQRVRSETARRPVSKNRKINWHYDEYNWTRGNMLLLAGGLSVAVVGAYVYIKNKI